jgi:hypothetical protein
MIECLPGASDNFQSVRVSFEHMFDETVVSGYRFPCEIERRPGAQTTRGDDRGCEEIHRGAPLLP